MSDKKPVDVLTKFWLWMQSKSYCNKQGFTHYEDPVIDSIYTSYPVGVTPQALSGYLIEYIATHESWKNHVSVQAIHLVKDTESVPLELKFRRSVFSKNIVKELLEIIIVLDGFDIKFKSS